jgi:hypothetical protein
MTIGFCEGGSETPALPSDKIADLPVSETQNSHVLWRDAQDHIPLRREFIGS